LAVRFFGAPIYVCSIAGRSTHALIWVKRRRRLAVSPQRFIPDDVAAMSL